MLFRVKASRQDVVVNMQGVCKAATVLSGPFLCKYVGSLPFLSVITTQTAGGEERMRSHDAERVERSHDTESAEHGPASAAYPLVRAHALVVLHVGREEHVVLWREDLERMKKKR